MVIRLLLLLFLIQSPIGQAADTPQLSKSILDKISKDGIFVDSKEISGAPWPEYTVVLPLNISAKDAVAIFSQYEEQKEYVPGVISAKIVAEVAPTDHHVAFEMYMPWPLSNTHYTTGNKLLRLGHEGYAVQWYFVNSDSTNDNRGQASFIPANNNKSSFLYYQSFIYPKSSFASIVKAKVKGDLVKTLTSIQNYLQNKAKTEGNQILEARKRIDQLLP